MYLYLIRHAETEMNRAGIGNGWSEDPLSENGKIQVQQLAIKLASVPFNIMRSSDLSRTKDTAMGIIEKNNHIKTLQTDARLREKSFGPYEGIPIQDMRNNAIAKGLTLQAYYASLPEIEQAPSVVKRFNQWLDENILGQSYDYVAVVTHGALLREVLSHTIGISGEHYANAFTPIKNTAITILDIHPESGVRKILTFNDHSHVETVL